MNSYKNFLGGVTLLFLAMTLLVFCSPLKRSAGLTGGIFGKIRFPMEESQFLLEKDTLLKQVSITIKGTDIKAKIDKDGYFWFLDLPTGEYTLEYFHPVYSRPHELQNVQVRFNKLTMAICLFKSNNYEPYKAEIEKDWKDENFGFLPLTDISKTGSVLLKFKNHEEVDANFILLIPDNKSRIATPYNLKHSIWLKHAVADSFYYNNVLSGRYDILLNILGRDNIYIQNVIIKKDSVTVFDNLYTTYESSQYGGTRIPIYKNIKEKK